MNPWIYPIAVMAVCLALQAIFHAPFLILAAAWFLYTAAKNLSRYQKKPHKVMPHNTKQIPASLVQVTKPRKIRDHSTANR